MVVVEYNRIVVVVVEYNKIVVAVVVEYNSIVVVVVESVVVESVIFLHRWHLLQILFSRFFSVQTILCAC